MKKTLLLLLLAMLLLASCGRKEPDPIPADENVPEVTETADASETIEAEEPEPAETEPDTAETAAETGEPEEVVIVLGDEPAETETAAETRPPETAPIRKDPAETDTVIKMLIPADYSDIHRALKDAQWFGVSYDTAINQGMAETGAPIEMPEAPIEMPEAEILYDTATAVPEEAAPGKVYREEDLYSVTNTQLADIDEGDIVKTDGEFIYVLKDGGELLILAADGESTRLMSRTGLTGEYSAAGIQSDGSLKYTEIHQNTLELYIHKDRAAVICSEFFWDNGKRSHKTYVDIYDVSDPVTPVYVTTLGQDGNYSASRMIDGTVWLITRHELYIRDIANPLDTESYIPGLLVKNTQTLIPENSIVYPEEITESVYTVVSSYNLSSAAREESKALLGVPADTVYMNGSHIYLADSQYYTEESDPYTEGVYTVTEQTSGQRTKIVKLDITDGIRTAAMAVIPGSLLNQFSMDEYNGSFRVVTTLNQQSYRIFVDETWGFRNTVWSDRIRANALYVLDSDLNITGRIENLAPDENVKSVRFTGNTGYFVTFRQVDPLFAVDLTDPANPVIMSELKIPGFSQYLHPWADGLLLGLGQDADINTGWSTGLKLSMFDTSDPYNVTEPHKLKLDYGWSAALTNHKAILVSESRNLIGFPADNGYAVYGYDSETGFWQKAFIEDLNGWDGLTRGLFVGEAVYIVMQKGCTVLDMNGFYVLATVGY